jgi:uncharacterized membrane protein
VNRIGQVLFISLKPKKILEYIFLAALFCPVIAFAYVGPGAGITMLGSLWGLIIAVIFVLFGLVFLPVKLLRNKLRKKKETAAREEKAELPEQEESVKNDIGNSE